MVRPERFELPTYSSGGCRSIQLSYGRVPVFQFTCGALAHQLLIDSRRQVAGDSRKNLEVANCGLGFDRQETIAEHATV